MYKSNDDLIDVSIVNLNMGELFIKQSEFEKAKECLNEGLDIAVKGQDKELIKNYYKSFKRVSRR